MNREISTFVYGWAALVCGTAGIGWDSLRLYLCAALFAASALMTMPGSN